MQRSLQVNGRDRTRRRWWAGAAVGTVAAVGVVLWWPFAPTSAPRAPGDAPESATEASKRPEAAKSGRVRSVVAGTQLMAGRHTLSYQMTMEAPTPSGQVKSQMRLDGELSLANAREDGWYVGRLVVTKLDVDASLLQPMGLEGGAAPDLFGETFALRVDEDGAIEQVRHDAAAAAGARNLVSGLLHAVQIVQTEEDVGVKVWEVREPDTDGQVDARYVRSDDVIEKRWERKSLGGEGAGADGNGGVQMEALGDARLQLAQQDGALRVQSASHHLNVEADLGMGGAAVRYHGTVHAELRRVGEVTADWATAVDVNAMEAGLGAKSVRAPKPSVQVAEGATVQGLIVAASAAARDQGQARRQLRGQLAELIARDPQNAREAAALLRQNRDDIDRRTLIEALASSDSAAAKVEMAGIMDDDKLDHDLRADVASATTFMPRPGETLIQSLQERAKAAGDDRLGTSALWALASQAELQQRYNAALSARLTAEVLARAKAALGAEGEALELAEAKRTGAVVEDVAAAAGAAAGAAAAEAAAAAAAMAKPVAQEAGTPADASADTIDPLKERPGRNATFAQAQAYLDALGNLGGEQVFKLIRPWTKHPDHQVRMTATMALRSVQTSAARVLIIDIMALDPDGWVRRSAVMAAAYHPPAAMADPVKRALKEDPHANVRLQAAFNLAFWAYESPKMMQLVRDAAEREPKPLVARAMRDLEPMLFRDTESGAVTMEPMLHGGKHIPSIPEGVIAVSKKVEATATTPEAGLVGQDSNSHATEAAEDAP